MICLSANYFGSVLVSMGFVGLAMLGCQARWLPGLRASLAAVGRMALTNYLAQTVLCLLIFHGYGLALSGPNTAGRRLTSAT